MQIRWAVKHDSISATFVDAGAAEFFLTGIQRARPRGSGVSKRLKYTHAEGAGAHAVGGSALGPDWVTELQQQGDGVSCRGE